ncbi:MAG: flagellar type III secretion system protein FlhA [Planctomycetota bacterium]|nr:MAG: flagellar type III secretion system protein FlhA [Planctomycetota bacterium]
MPSQQHAIRDVVSRRFSLALPLLIVGAILVLIAPLPAMVLDVLLAANLTASLIVLLTAIHVRNPLEFSTFPSVLLGTALVRLVLNVASTRLILTQGAQGTHAAGDVIHAFGQFVAAGSPAVGCTLFVILVAIQFLVITSGSTRISEVGARFALDSMPGKQQAIDSDLAAGIITREEAIQRRQLLVRQADFYGAMDGASKFVRGDAIAGLLITAINIGVGLALGVFEYGMTLGEAAQVFSTLTIGDGLVAQLPAFLIALASGLIVTRSSVDSDLARDTVTQVFQHAPVLYITAAALSVLAFTGLPMIPMLTFAAASAALGWLIDETPTRSHNTSRPTPATQIQLATTPSPTATTAAQDPKAHLHVEPLQLDLGVGLVRLADTDVGGDLLVRVTRLRTQVAEQLGFILPKVRIQDNLHLEPFQYQIRLREACVARGVIDPDAMLAVESFDSLGALDGEQVREPLSDRAAWWITGEEIERAQSLGFQLLEPQQVISNHLAAVVHRHSEELLTRQQVHALIENLQLRAPQLVAEVLPLVPVAKMHRVLSLLLREQVPIRDLETIIEALGDHAESARDVSELVERIRGALARTICQQYRTGDRKLVALSLSRDLEDELSTLLRISAADPLSAWPSRQRQLAIDAISLATTLMRERGLPAVVICRNELRPLVKQLTQYTLPHLAVLSQAEITRDTELVIAGRVETATQETVGV